MSSRFVRSTHCFLYDKDSRIKSSRRATKSLLLPGVLILFWAENPRSHSIVCYVRIIDVEVLLHSTAIARPRTIRIIETTYYYSVFASVEALFHPRTEKTVIILNLIPSKRKATKKFRMKLSKIYKNKKTQKLPHVYFFLSCAKPTYQENDTIARHFTT